MRAITMTLIAISFIFFIFFFVSYFYDPPIILEAENKNLEVDSV